MLRVRQYALSVAPLALLLALYWPGLTNWFYQDDFGWLNIGQGVHSAAELWPVLFAPKAHGNMRALGDNAYFLVFSSLFGLNALPFRIWVFAVQMASLLLLGTIVRQLTGSRAAGFWAQILWIVNNSVADTMSWTSIHNQVLSGLFFLLAFYFLLRQIETGARRFYIAQWAAFVLGIGALETNVMYPALAAVYTLLFARPFLKKILPMFLVSALWTLVHFRVAPVAHAGPYALHFDARMFSTACEYWKLMLGPPRLAVVRPETAWLSAPAITLLTIAAVALVAWKTSRRDYLGLFAAGWSLIVLAPYLPLRDHITAYYVAVPAIGLAILGGWAIAGAWRSSAVWKACAALCVAVYLGVSVPGSWAITRWHHDRGTRVEDLVLGVAEVHRSAPDKFVLLDGVDTDLFWSAVADLPFRVMRIPHVYLTPGSEASIQAPGELVGKYILPREPALRALQENRAVVYRAAEYGGSPALRNITDRYRMTADATWKPETPRFINLGDSAFDEYLGPGWSASADGYRYMRGVGTLRIGGPRDGKDCLHVGVFRTRNFQLGLRVNGLEVSARLAQRDFDLSEITATLPPSAIGASAMEISLSSDTGEPLKFGFVEVR
jgi:hypothetical protein